jgi:ubiquinone/menaquinone biosynthesis C-methylase UbiE
MIDELPTKAIDKNTWGDAYFGAYDSAVDAVSHALRVRDALRNFDWRMHGLRNPPMVRTAIAAGPVSWKLDSIDSLRKRLTGEVFVDSARLEPCVRPGEVWVTDEVATLASRGSDEFYFERIPDVVLPKNRGKLPANRAQWRHEEQWLRKDIASPLNDSQHCGRREALRRFAFLWLLLDQLPAGSWGRSVPAWMNEVFKGIPSIPSNPLIEDEGGFETTILNLHLLLNLLARKFQFTKVCNTAFNYLFHRYDARGFGTMSLSRHGAEIESQPRHTALAAWLFATEGKFHDQAEEIFRSSSRVLLGGDQERSNQERILNTFLHDRNPFLLYLLLWQIDRLINSPDWENPFDQRERDQMAENWHYCEQQLRSKALQPGYGPESGGPSDMLADRQPLFPLIVPYGGFVRMESYSLLSSVALFDSTLPRQVQTRITQAIVFIANEYLSSFGSPENRYSRDPLRPFPVIGGQMKPRGVRPHFADKSVSPDIGSTALLYRALRHKDLHDLLAENWPGDMPSIEETRYFLEEDLVHQFDRYLVSPEIFSLTNAGMLASILASDHPDLIGDLQTEFRQLIDNPLTSLALSTETLDRVLSEKSLLELVETHIGTDKTMEPATLQLSTHSLARLLLDRVRPGRYIRDAVLSSDAIKSISAATRAVYDSPAFVEKYNTTWRDEIDRTILTPFLSMLGSQPRRILDVGCGPGQYAVEMAKAGHAVELLDGSSSILKIAADMLRQHGHNPITHQLDLTDNVQLSKLGESYDAIWCCGTFVHFPKAVWPQILQWFKERLAVQSGVLFINMMYDNSCVFSKDGRYFAYIRSSSEFEEVLSRAGFSVSHVLRKRIDRNTYGEPLLQTSWANFYAHPQVFQTSDFGMLASSLTSFAYERSFRIFEERYAPQEDRRRYFSDLVVQLSAYLDKYLEGDGTRFVLDVGCGSGDMLRALGDAGFEAVGVDLSEQMVTRARFNNTATDKQPLIEICDMCTLPRTWSNKFDGLFCITALQHQPVRSGRFLKALKEFARVLKTNGIARIDIRIGYDSGFDPDLRFIEAFPNENDVIKYAEEAGFELVGLPHRKTMESGVNSFRRDIEMNYADLWLKCVKKP